MKIMKKKTVEEFLVFIETNSVKVAVAAGESWYPNDIREIASEIRKLTNMPRIPEDEAKFLAFRPSGALAPIKTD
jgi:hypothetical protein